MLSICDRYFGKWSTLIADDVSQAFNLPLGETGIQSQLLVVDVRFWTCWYSLTPEPLRHAVCWAVTCSVLEGGHLCALWPWRGLGCSWPAGWAHSEGLGSLCWGPKSPSPSREVGFSNWFINGELCPVDLESDQRVAACCRMMMCKRWLIKLIKQPCGPAQWHASPALCSGGTAGKKAFAFPGL